MNMALSREVGSLMYIRYRDHVLFTDTNPQRATPITRECVGWLDYEDEEYIRLIWERYAMPNPPNESKPKATGLVILKKTILETRKIG
jgi:hypothetical protein